MYRAANVVNMAAGDFGHLRAAMLCDCCKKNEAKIQVCDIEQNAVAHQFAVCNDCMTLLKRLVFDPATALIPTGDAIKQVQGMLSSKDKNMAVVEQPGAPASPEKPAETLPTCPTCNMTLAEFKQRGRFGCANDYEVFAAHIDPLLERIHDSQPPQHRGRLPKGKIDTSATDKAREVAALQDQLDHAVLSEDYERAAKLRDRLTQLTGGAPKAKTKTKKTSP